jgi:hypothetical protein
MLVANFQISEGKVLNLRSANPIDYERGSSWVEDIFANNPEKNNWAIGGGGHINQYAGNYDACLDRNRERARRRQTAETTAEEVEADEECFVYSTAETLPICQMLCEKDLTCIMARVNSKPECMLGKSRVPSANEQGEWKNWLLKSRNGGQRVFRANN